jgi:hypothetical protein
MIADGAAAGAARFWKSVRFGVQTFEISYDAEPPESRQTFSAFGTVRHLSLKTRL